MKLRLTGGYDYGTGTERQSHTALMTGVISMSIRLRRNGYQVNELGAVGTGWGGI